MNYVFFKEEEGKGIVTESVPEEDIQRVAEAGQDVMRVYRVEEIFHMVMSALLEFNAQVFRQADLRRFAANNDLDYELLRIRINQCSTTFLTSLAMYQDYLVPGKGKGPFSNVADKFLDSRFGVCKALRNYLQHAATFGINIRVSEVACACQEGLCSFAVAANVPEIKRNLGKLRPSTQADLLKYVDGNPEINLFEIFNGVVDVLFAIHQDVRNSPEYAVEYKKSAKFLSEMHSKLIGRGFYRYQTTGAGGHPSWNPAPYFYHRQREAIDYLRRRYGVSSNSNTSSCYAIVAPKTTIDRMAEADRLVERFVKQNGVVADFGDHRIANSAFQTEKMRAWYLQE